MEFSFYALLLVPVGLGLLGFIEPCTIGTHLLFLKSPGQLATSDRVTSSIVFVGVRVLTAGLVGAFVASLGQHLIATQTTVWLIFGAAYTLIGLAYLFGQAGLIKLRIDFAPSSLKATRIPALLGVVFGLNVPACAVPILFDLIGLAASAGSIAMGFVAMALFGLSLSMPLVLFVLQPKLAVLVQKIDNDSSRTRWVLGAVFVVLGLWSIWFGIYVEPADWAVI